MKKVVILFLVALIAVVIVGIGGESNEDAAVRLIRDHTYEGEIRSIGEQYQKLVGEAGSVSWVAFRPQGEPSEKIYCVEVVIEKNENQALFQYLINVETENWEASYMSLNEEPMAFTHQAVDQVWQTFGED